MRVKKLDKKFTKKGDVFTQIEIGDNYYIYKRDIGDFSCYEIFEKRIVTLNDYMRRYDLSGKYTEFDAYEQYPNDEHFGHWAYCCSNFEKTRKYIYKFNNKND